jgi:hypothetical protein
MVQQNHHIKQKKKHLALMASFSTHYKVKTWAECPKKEGLT